MKRVALDLFCGSGAATQAFRDAGDWQVIGVDIVPGPSVDVVADCRRLPLEEPVDFLWSSPPCTEFSDANPRIDHAAKRPSLELIVATLEAVRLLRPRYWILENVRGAIPFLGIPAQKVGPFCLWGYFPLIEPSFLAQTYRKDQAGRAPAARAAVPLELSRAVHQAVTRAWDVRSVLDLRPFRRHRHRAARRRPEPDLFAS